MPAGLQLGACVEVAELAGALQRKSQGHAASVEYSEGNMQPCPPPSASSTSPPTTLP